MLASTTFSSSTLYMKYNMWFCEKIEAAARHAITKQKFEQNKTTTATWRKDVYACLVFVRIKKSK